MAQELGPNDPLAAFPTVPADRARLGQLLFYDKILSGNRNISCGTCHHHALHGADGVSLGIGEGGSGLGPDRHIPPGAHILRRVPRNAPALWNLGHPSVTALFHDGRVQIGPDGFDTPANDWLPEGLDSLLAAQALFPMTSETEMAGHSSENEVAGAVNDRIDKGWPILAARVRAVPAYGPLFLRAFPQLGSTADITIVHIANALGAFIATEWQSFDSPYDAYLREGTPLTARAEAGRRLFFGAAGCGACHNGPLLTDGQFHAAGVPAFGPGRTRPFDPMPRDTGRMAASDLLEDAYRFRTPSLRNVALTAPYGHNGAFPDLRSMIRHMADPQISRAGWVPAMAALPAAPHLAAQDFALSEDRLEMARQAAAVDWQPVALSDQEVQEIEAFLHTLTGASVLDRPLGPPSAVPSGLPVDLPATVSLP